MSFKATYPIDLPKLPPEPKLDRNRFSDQLLKARTEIAELKGYTSEQRIGLKVYQHGLDNGVLLRPLGHVVYFMPPYIITKEEIDKMMDVAFEAIELL